MNFRKGQRREDPEINLIPFIDVLLVILIFLMVSTTYSKYTELQITLPTADAQKATEKPFELNVTVDAKGKSFPLVEGKIRARFRESMSQPSLLEPGKVYAYNLDLWQTGMTVPKGHRLRVEVASAAFPIFSRNLNTGGHNETETKFVTAEQSVYHSAEYPSHVVLPMIPEEAPGTK